MKLSDGNPMARVLMVTLLFEAVVFALTIPGMIVVLHVPQPLAFGVGLGGAVLALVAAGTLRRGGYALGWLAQVFAVGLGVLIPTMFVLGGLFAALWVVSFVLGRRLDAR